MNSQFSPISFIEEAIPFPLYIFGILVEDYLAEYRWVYFEALCSVPLDYVSVFMPASYCFDYYNSVICCWLLKNTCLSCTSPLIREFFSIKFTPSMTASPVSSTSSASCHPWDSKNNLSSSSASSTWRQQRWGSFWWSTFTWWMANIFSLPYDF